LHFLIIQSSSISKDSQRIARERRLREYVNLNEFVRAVWYEGNLSMCIRRRAKKLVSCGAVRTACVIVFTMWRGSNFPEKRRSTAALQSASRERNLLLRSCFPDQTIKHDSDLDCARVRVECIRD